MERDKIIVKTSILGIIVNIFLVTFKAGIGFITNSIAIIMDAINNLTDAMSSVITIVGTKLSLKEPNKKHPYGYGRIEYFTSVIIAILVLLAGITAFKESLEKIIHPLSTNYNYLSIIIILIFVFVKFFFGRYVKNIGNKVNSGSLVASGEDAYMDSILSFTTLIGAILNFMFKINIEGYLGIIISIFIIKSSLEMIKETVDSLLGERADKNLAKKLKKEVMKFPEVEGVYDLNIHNYGVEKIIASLHIQVNDDMTAREIHILTRNITYVIFEKFGITLTIGIYAANSQGEFGEIKKELINLVKKYKTILQLHGFYVDSENKEIFFDLIFDFKEQEKDKIKREIIDKMKEKYNSYNYNVIIDYDITD